VIAIETDVSDARRWDETRDSLDHPEAGAQDRHERELLPAHPHPRRALERSLDGRRLEGELAGGLVRDQRRDLVDQLLEDLGRRRPRAEQRHLVLHERVRDDPQRRECRGGVHGAEATNFAPMKEYQAVMLRLTRHARDDEDALTDLLNERSRAGWRPAMMSQDEHRVTLVFERPGDGES